MRQRNVTESSWIMLFFIVVSSHYCFFFSITLCYHCPFVSFLMLRVARLVPYVCVCVCVSCLRPALPS